MLWSFNNRPNYIEPGTQKPKRRFRDAFAQGHEIGEAGNRIKNRFMHSFGGRPRELGVTMNFMLVKRLLQKCSFLAIPAIGEWDGRGRPRRLRALPSMMMVGLSVLLAACGSDDSIGSSSTSASSPGPIFYIDPTCADNGDGTTTTCGEHGPFNSWKNISTWLPGAIYAGKGGTSETLTTLVLRDSGSPGKPITVTSYGASQFTFRSTTSFAFAASDSSYITWDNVAFESTATHCLYLASTGRHLVVRRSTFTRCGRTGVATHGVLLEQGPTNDFDHIAILDNTFTGVTGSAVSGILDVASTQNWDTITVSNNTITGAGSQASAPAIDLIAIAGTSGTISNIDISGNVITDSNVGWEPASSLVRVFRNISAVPRENRFLGVRITNNTLSNSRGGIFVSHVSLLPGVQNCICNNTLSNLVTNAGIAPWATTDMIVEQNMITGLIPGITGIDGMGIDAERNIAPRPHNMIIRQNIIRDNLGGHGNPTGQGIYLWGSASNDVYANLIVHCHTGLLIDGGENADENFIGNNTIVDSTQDGIWGSFSVTQISQFTNNIIVGSGRYGFYRFGVSDQILTSNLFFGNQGGDYFRQIAHPTDINGSDPLFVGPNDYRLQPTSPARGSGVNWGTLCADLLGQPCRPGLINLGAYQN